ncbi:four helix bundle protein [Flavobacterium psychrophilum]|uniref:Four helix bundle protein n=1 Tax=Flavobacterium psychrophilum (strain ATCC 49511 / DSM 21280 / CIP 103535 / JIP02/86) TaxID=402612 RepID=A6GYP0_FLAPJ|nr:four helix bundle protein [Flavobacterium psychrophilum]AIG29925.1 30S ribosomal protein S23 [Flavobacterium psychrophilum]AIG32202.1 30S ribosomal protein S23 [Flavobacterium psychrophilum]AIG34358.1 30S ribosomal protein S23 [Flavobacterium psychrophilum]AIG36721.1 30S ribosomal protein S23 [Flavobacterium psychrophilum]AIG38985.1 30S ribosomal protein S23 [Flavobacterium psychrophilum]
MFTYSFEKLEVWVESKNFSKSIYLVTSKFPDNEKYGLISQLRRASISICSNIAEGSARNSFKDKAHFTTMAFSSAVEVLNQLIICFEIEFISENEYFKLRGDLESITNKLNALRTYQVNKSTEASK